MSPQQPPESRATGGVPRSPSYVGGNAEHALQVCSAGTFRTFPEHEHDRVEEKGERSTAESCSMCGNAAHAQEDSGLRPHCAHESLPSRSERRPLISDERSTPPRALVAAMTQVRVQHEFTWNVDFRHVCGCGRRFGPRRDWETHLSEELAAVALSVLARRVARG